MQMIETYGTSSALDTLICELETMSKRYRTFLEQESLTGDVQCLHHWITSYKGGRLEAGEYIHEYGHALLSNIKNKLKLAEQDIQRMDGESPSIEHSTGKQPHRLSQAIALTIAMQEHVKQVTDDEICA